MSDFIEPNIAYLPLVSFGICAFASLSVLFFDRLINVRDTISVAASILNFIVVLIMYSAFQSYIDMPSLDFTLWQNLTLSFKIDALGLVFALTSSFLWIANTFYSIGYLRAEKAVKQTRFFSFFALAVAAAMVAAFSANLLTLFICYEILTLSTFPLVIHYEDKNSIKAAKTYLFYLLGASIAFLLPALIILYTTAGSFDFVQGGLLANINGSWWTFYALFFLLLFGFAKNGLFPLHGWLPRAMVAPTPVSALLHAVAVVKMGVFCVIRVALYIFGTPLLFKLGIGQVAIYIALFTMVFGAIMALL